MNKENILKILEGAKDKNGDVPMRLVRLAFKKLPEPCTDIISRQAAIDALAKHEKSNGHNYTLFVDIVSECAEIIRDLPSAQPEIIHCKECKYAHMTYDGDCKYCDVWFPDESEYVGGDYYCASAERKTDD